MIQWTLSFILAAILIFQTSCSGQSKNSMPSPKDKIVGGPFENRDYMYKTIPGQITPIDTSAGWNEEGEKLLIKGTILKQDGKTPAADVILYYYQTNVDGRYVHKPSEPHSMPPNDRGQTHGYIRGWVKTGQDGKYEIYTIRPGVYPTRDEPAHIHMTIKEPNVIEYYIDDVIFEEDELVTGKVRQKLMKRGGNGIVTLSKQGDLSVGARDIILGYNIPYYEQ